MIIDRYPAENLLALVPKLAAEFAPELRELDRLLDDDVLFQRVKADLGRRRPRSLCRGRHSTPVAVILRLLVVKRLYRWSDEQPEHFVGDRLVLRQFGRGYLEPVPDDTTLIRGAQWLGPEPRERPNERVIALARSLQVTRGRQLRVDSTVVETTLHHPTDSRLVGEGGRGLSRRLRRAQARVGAVPGLSRRAFEGPSRSRRLARPIQRLARRQGEAAAEERRSAYQRLTTLGQRTCAQGVRGRRALADRADAAAHRLAGQIDQFLPLVQRAIEQAIRRVRRGEAVPAADKIVSLFEPHTPIIRRHKAGQPVERGRKLRREEVDGGLVSGSRPLAAAGQDHASRADSLPAPQRRCGQPPWRPTGDRGGSSPANQPLAQPAGVRRVALPATRKVPAACQAYARAPPFRRAYRFRAGIEGRIRVWPRDFERGRCRDRGAAGMARWVGWGILTPNLAKSAQTAARRAAKVARRSPRLAGSRGRARSGGREPWCTMPILPGRGSSFGHFAPPTRACVQMLTLEPEHRQRNHPQGPVALAPLLVAGGQAAVRLAPVDQALDPLA